VRRSRRAPRFAPRPSSTSCRACDVLPGERRPRERLESGKGSRLKDLDGKSYLNFFGGILTVSLGQANERVNAAIHAQIDRLGHVSTLYPTIPAADLAEKLVKLAPGKIAAAGKAFFSASGTEADETAVALAQIFTGRQELIALRHGYSGRSLLAQTLTAHAKYRNIPTQVGGIKHAHAPYCYRCPFDATYPSCGLKCAQDIEELIQTLASPPPGAAPGTRCRKRLSRSWHAGGRDGTEVGFPMVLRAR
jgi:4-aminobutyrate aminotransferase-like enzyme